MAALAEGPADVGQVTEQRRRRKRPWGPDDPVVYEHWWVVASRQVKMLVKMGLVEVTVGGQARLTDAGREAVSAGGEG